MKIPTGVLLTAAVAFGPPPAAAGDATNAVRAVQDLTGRDVAVPAQVNRLVALGPGALRLVAYLQAVDKVVGIEDMEKR